MLLCCCLCALAPIAFAAEDSDSADVLESEMQAQLESVGADELYELLPDDSKQLLEELGVTMPDIGQLNQVTPLNVFQSLGALLSGTAVNPLRGGILILGVLLLAAVLGSLLGDEPGRQGMLTLCVGAFLAATLAPYLWNCLSTARAAIIAACDFSLAYVPVLTALAAANGSISASLSYSAMTLGLAEVMAQFSKRFLLPCTGIFIGVNMAANISGSLDFSALTQAVKKTVTVALAFCGTVFTGLITAKGVLAKGVDTVALKGAKFVVGSFVPVIGGSVSDALGSIMSGLSIVKNSVGIFAILAIAAILGPALVELLLWNLCLNLCAGVAGALGEERAGKLLKGISDGLALLHIILIFSLILLVISTAVILTVKAEF